MVGLTVTRGLTTLLLGEMKAKDVVVGGIYAVCVNKKNVPVKILRKSEDGGWVGINLETNRILRFASSRRLKAFLGDGTGVIPPVGLDR